jgi:hypothetical protein
VPRSAEPVACLHRISPLSPALAGCLLVGLQALAVRVIRPEATVPTGSPSVCRDSAFSRPSTEGGLAMLQARAATRWGVNGDSDPSRSARQQKKSRRSTGSTRAGSEDDGTLATGGRLRLTSGDPRRHRCDGQDAGRTRRTDGSEPGHLIEEARSEETGGRASARTACGRDRKRSWRPWMSARDARAGCQTAS